MKRTRKVLTAMLCVLMFATVFPALNVTADNYPQYDEKPLSTGERQAVQNAIDILKLTGDQGNLEDKLNKGEIKEADLNKGKKPGDPVTTKGFGESDDGKILIDKRMFERQHGISPITSVEDLVGMADQAFKDLKDLAEILIHEATHNQQTGKEMSGSDNNIKNCGSEWSEREAYYAELLWKLELKAMIEQLAEQKPELKSQCDAKIKILDDQIKNVLDTIDTLTEVVDTTEGKKAKTIEGPDFILTIGEVYNASIMAGDSLEELIRKIGVMKDAAKEKCQEMGEKMLENRTQSEVAPIDPQTGGSVTLPGGEAWITIPSNSLPVPTDIEIYEMDLTGLPAGLKTLSPVYELGPDGTMFDHSNPVSLTIKISDPGAIHNANIYRWNSNVPGQWVGRWELIDSGKRIDIDHNTISVDIDHFSYYTVSDDSPPVDGCFITTATYGSPMAPQIDVLRDFRDQYLLTNPAGEALVELYYKTSQPIANFITEHPALKPVVRAALVPAIAMSTVAVKTTLAEKIAIVSLMVVFSTLLVFWLRRRTGKVRGSAN